jgi:hypothetical protein
MCRQAQSLVLDDAGATAVVVFVMTQRGRREGRMPMAWNISGVM